MNKKYNDCWNSMFLISGELNSKDLVTFLN